MMINRIFFTGNLTADPELIEVGKSKVVNGSLANNEFYTDDSNERQQITTYLDIKIWGAPAENFAKLAKQGQEFFVEGMMRQDRWEDDQGNKRSKTYIRVSNWQFTQRKSEGSSSAPAKPNGRIRESANRK
ncbi:MAG TPA: single-stranded DNA-binding protein [Chthoniobacterales bacterium]|jgi:single-strand DNA-binding protein|nr:single-stranded DNA-binding protein [Chthoniobacterales bacterium]